MTPPTTTAPGLSARQLQSLRNMGNECEAAADEIERLRALLERSRRGEHICLKCGLRQDGYDAAAHAAAYPAF